jgi:hemerythrin
MPLIHWNSSYCARHPEMDAHHEQLASLLNELAGAFHTQAPAAAVLPILDALERHTLEHFSSEDRLMQETGYPASPEQEHADLLLQLRGTRQDIADGAAQLSSTLLLFLKQWLLQHVMGSDRDLADHLRQPASQAL